MVLPDPFPNSEVKRFSGDDSCGATYRENISPPEQCFESKNLQILMYNVSNYKKKGRNDE